MELLTVQEVMAIFHLKDSRTIYNWLYYGSLPRETTVKVGRNLFFIKSKLEEFLLKKSEA